MRVVSMIAAGMLLFAACIGSVRALRRGDLADRAVAMEVLTSILTCGLLCMVVLTGDVAYLDLAVVLGLLAFLTSVTVSRYVERRGS